MPIHFYLSPHLDDAILSCGGIIYQQRLMGDTVNVITFCAGSPDYSNLSPFAQEYHRNWGEMQDPMEKRRAEDNNVLKKLGITAYHGKTLDSIYRRIEGEIVYPDLTSLFSEPNPRELIDLPMAWKKELSLLISDPAETILYAPLAAGNHVDHQLVRKLAKMLIEEQWRVWFYEDFPHAEKPGSVVEALAWIGDRNWIKKTSFIRVDEKINSISGYRSQISQIFGDDHSLKECVKHFTAETARDICFLERMRFLIAGSGGRREFICRKIFGYHAHAERLWQII